MGKDPNRGDAEGEKARKEAGEIIAKRRRELAGEPDAVERENQRKIRAHTEARKRRGG